MWVMFAALVGLLAGILLLQRLLPLVALATGIIGFFLLARGASASGAVLLIATLFVFVRYYALSREMAGHVAECERCMELERAFVDTNLGKFRDVPWWRSAHWWRWAIAHNRQVSAHLREVYGSRLGWWFHPINRAKLEARHQLPDQLSKILADWEREPGDRAKPVPPEGD
jgi:hypothetical protein